MARRGCARSVLPNTDGQLASALHIHLHMWPGGHDYGYWDQHWNNYLGFYAHALATCR